MKILGFAFFILIFYIAIYCFKHWHTMSLGQKIFYTFLDMTILGGFSIQDIKDSFESYEAYLKDFKKKELENQKLKEESGDVYMDYRTEST